MLRYLQAMLGRPPGIIYSAELLKQIVLVWSNSTVGRTLALHMSNLVQSPAPHMFSQGPTRSKSWAQLGMTSKPKNISYCFQLPVELSGFRMVLCDPCLLSCFYSDSLVKTHFCQLVPVYLICQSFIHLPWKKSNLCSNAGLREIYFIWSSFQLFS